MAALVNAVLRDNQWTPSTTDMGGGSSALATITPYFYVYGSKAGLTINLGYPTANYPLYAWGSVPTLVAYQPELNPQATVAGNAKYTLSGTAKIGTTPLAYQPIDVYFKPNGLLAAQTLTDANGNWSVGNLLNLAGVYYALCRDDNNTTYNGQIWDNLTAA